MRNSERLVKFGRSSVEYPFKIIKNTFGYTKCVYRGLAKNLARLHVLFASANFELNW